jgi:hypothetical protein
VGSADFFGAGQDAELIDSLFEKLEIFGIVDV